MTVATVAARLLARPALVVVVTLALAASALARLVDFTSLTPRLTVEPSMTALAPRTGATLQAYERALSLFGDDDRLLVAWFASRPFGAGELDAWKQLTRRVERVSGVTRVESLANALHLDAGAESTRLDPYLRESPQTAGDAAALIARAVADPLVNGRLVAPDGRGLLLSVEFSPGLASATLLERVDAIAAAARARAGPLETVVTGPLMVRLQVARLLLDDLLRVMPLAIAATLVVAVLGARSLHGVVLPLLGNLAAVLVTLAVFTATGHALNFVTVILAPVVYVIGFAYAIHVVTEFDRHHAAAGDRRAAAARALQEIAGPLGLTALTTVIAFAALALNSIDAIRLFGLFAALGVALAWLGAMTVVPAGLVLLPSRAKRARDTDARARRLARVLTARRGGILAAGCVLGVAALFSASRIEVDTDVLGNFAPASPVRYGFDRVAERFAGAVPLRVMIEAERPDALKEPAALAAVAELDAWLTAQPEIGAVYSLADYVGALHRAIDPERARNSPLPDTARQTGHLLLAAGGPEVRRFADPAFRATMLHLRTRALSTAAVNTLAERIELRLATLPEPLHGRVTGTTHLIAQTVDAISRGQVVGLASAFGGVFALLAVAFRSWRLAALALVPNVLPVLCYFGLLGASAITLNLTTSLVACAVFGIAIDDTVHFFARYRRAARTGATPDAAVAAAVAAVIRPVSLTTFALVAGFAALCASQLSSQAEFGLLAAATLLVAWVLDLSFTPALCHRFHRLHVGPSASARPA